MIRNRRDLLLSAGQIILGNAISAFAVVCFALPYDMVVSGVTGIANALNYYIGTNISVVVWCINITLFVIGYLALGKKFAAAIVVGSFSFPFFVSVYQSMPGLHHLVDDPLLAAICAGVLDGVGLGLILRTGGSSGGIDIPPIIMNRKFGWKIAPFMYAIDVAIFIAQIPFTGTNGVILGILYALIYSFIMNEMLMMNQGGAQMLILSTEVEKTNERLLQLDFGTTLLHSTGGYLRNEQDVILCVVDRRNVNRVKKEVLAIDKFAFITICAASEINGNGFTLLLNDEEYKADVKQRQSGEVVISEEL